MIAGFEVKLNIEVFNYSLYDQTPSAEVCEILEKGGFKRPTKHCWIKRYGSYLLVSSDHSSIIGFPPGFSYVGPAPTLGEITLPVSSTIEKNRDKYIGHEKKSGRTIEGETQIEVKAKLWILSRNKNCFK